VVGVREDLHIVTGAPGTGKSAILSGLAPVVRVIGEPAREILAEQRSIDGSATWDRDPSSFVSLLLERSIEKRTAAIRAGGISVFDRGIPDCIAYAVALDVDPGPARRAARRYRYADDVLLMPPWEDIYTVDEERRMSFANVLEFHASLVQAYEAVGYRLNEVPRDSIERRAAFVRSAVMRRRPSGIDGLGR
jgi:predicted ATPase